MNPSSRFVRNAEKKSCYRVFSFDGKKPTILVATDKLRLGQVTVKDGTKVGPSFLTHPIIAGKVAD